MTTSGPMPLMSPNVMPIRGFCEVCGKFIFRSFHAVKELNALQVNERKIGWDGIADFNDLNFLPIICNRFLQPYKVILPKFN